jgi:hypothetical protein
MAEEKMTTPQLFDLATFDAVNTPPPLTDLTEAAHVFGQPIWMPLNRQTERTCAICGAVKVTVHGEDGFAWRAWRAKGSSEQGPLHIACAGQIAESAP